MLDNHCGHRTLRLPACRLVEAVKGNLPAVLVLVQTIVVVAVNGKDRGKVAGSGYVVDHLAMAAGNGVH